MRLGKNILHKQYSFKLYTIFLSFLLLILVVACIIYFLMIVSNGTLKRLELQNDQKNLPSLEKGLRGESFQISLKVLTRNGSDIKLYNRTTPIVFIGGYPGSGSFYIKQLVEKLLDLKCTLENRELMYFLGMAATWKSSNKESNRLFAAHLTPEILFDAVSSFAHYIISGESAVLHRDDDDDFEQLCVHETISYRHAIFLSKVYPNSKFVFVVRDPRVVIHKIFTNITFSLNERVPLKVPDPFNSYSEGFKSWKMDMSTLLESCRILGVEKCHVLRFEDIFKFSQTSMKQLIEFLGYPMEATMVGEIGKLKHELYPLELPFEAQEQVNTSGLENILELLGYDLKTAPLTLGLDSPEEY